MALMKGMFSRRRRPSARFGLRNAQLSPKRGTAVRNASWFNAAGEKLGWGDLSFDDLHRIAAGLRGRETFIILDQSYGYFAFLFPKHFRNAGRKGPMDRPGASYVRRHARYEIMKDGVWTVDPDGVRKPLKKKRGR